jgi:hypothetical protein
VEKSQQIEVLSALKDDDPRSTSPLHKPQGGIRASPRHDKIKFSTIHNDLKRQLMGTAKPIEEQEPAQVIKQNGT